jgi:hypothetical protein
MLPRHDMSNANFRTRTMPACVRVSATGLVDSAVSDSSPPSSRRTNRSTILATIKRTDAEGRSCIYVPITQGGKVVDSQGYMLGLEDE